MLVPGAGLGVPHAAVHTAVRRWPSTAEMEVRAWGSDLQAAPVCLSPASRARGFLPGDSEAFVHGFSPWKGSRALTPGKTGDNSARNRKPFIGTHVPSMNGRDGYTTAVTRDRRFHVSSAWRANLRLRSS